MNIKPSLAINPKTPKAEVTSSKGALSHGWVKYIKGSDLSVRAVNVLLQNCSSLEELNLFNEATLLNLKNCGRKTVQEVLDFIKDIT